MFESDHQVFRVVRRLSSWFSKTFLSWHFDNTSVIYCLRTKFPSSRSNKTSHYSFIKKSFQESTRIMITANWSLHSFIQMKNWTSGEVENTSPFESLTRSLMNSKLNLYKETLNLCIHVLKSVTKQCLKNLHH